MPKRIACLIPLLLFCILLNGCWDRREVENLGLVQALGLDLEPATRKVIVTTMIAIPSKLGGQGGGGGGEGPGVTVVSMKAPSIYEGFNLINTTINREISLQQTQLLVIGESIAKHDLKPLVDNLVRFRDSRRSLLLFVCRGKAADILQFQPKLEQNPAEYLYDLVNLSQRTGMFPKVTLNDFMNSYEAYTQENFTPLLAPYTPPEEAETKPDQSGGESAPPAEGKSTGGEKASKKPSDIQLIGTAVFKDRKLKGNLDLYETQAFQIIINRFGQAFITIPDPLQKGMNVAVRLFSASAPQIKYNRNAGVDQFSFKTSLEADIVSIQSGINYSDPQKGNILARKIALTLRNRLQKVIRKAQTDFQSDIFGFGVKVRDTMLTTQEWEAYHWPQKFPAAQFKVQVKVAIRRIGVQFQPPQPR